MVYYHNVGNEKEHTMYQIYLYNMGFALDRTFATLAEAKEAVEDIYFDAVINDTSTGNPVATFRSIGGWS